MEDRLIEWHFNCPQETAPLIKEQVSLELLVSKEKVLRGLASFWGREYAVWTHTTRGKLAFPPRPWQCKCQPSFFTAAEGQEAGKVALRLRRKEDTLAVFEAMWGKGLADAIRAMVVDVRH